MSPLQSLLFLSCCACLSARAQQSNTFQWGDAMETYTGTYDPAVHSKSAIEHVYTYLVAPTSLTGIGHVWKISEFNDLPLEEVMQECRKIRSALDSLDFPDGAEWETLIASRRMELQRVCSIKMSYLVGFNDPKMLYTVGGDHCLPVTAALNGTETQLLQAWAEVVDIQKKANCCPEKLEEEYRQQLASPDRLRYARLTVMNFGWWNCVNQTIPYVDTYPAEQLFRTLFTEIETTMYYDEEE